MRIGWSLHNSLNFMGQTSSSHLQCVSTLFQWLKAQLSLLLHANNTPLAFGLHKRTGPILHQEATHFQEHLAAPQSCCTFPIALAQSLFIYSSAYEQSAKQKKCLLNIGCVTS